MGDCTRSHSAIDVVRLLRCDFFFLVSTEFPVGFLLLCSYWRNCCCHVRILSCPDLCAFFKLGARLLFSLCTLYFWKTCIQEHPYTLLPYCQIVIHCSFLGQVANAWAFFYMVNWFKYANKCVSKISSEKKILKMYHLSYSLFYSVFGSKTRRSDKINIH